MTACKAIAKLLKLNKILKIVDFRFCRDGSLRLDVKPFQEWRALSGMRPPQSAGAPSCGRTPVARLTGGGSGGESGICPREIMCPTHGRRRRTSPGLRVTPASSYRFEYAVLRLCQVMTQKAASELPAYVRLDSL